MLSSTDRYQALVRGVYDIGTFADDLYKCMLHSTSAY